MRTIYERHTEQEGEEEMALSIEEVEDERDATHVHYCYHDEENPRPCKRKRIPL
jgi:hypothetical protein